MLLTHPPKYRCSIIAQTNVSHIWTVAADGQKVEQLTALAGPNVNWPVWSPDAKSLFYTIFGIGSFRIDTTKPWSKQTPEGLPPWNKQGELFSAWSWSPDGRKLAGFLQRADGIYAGITIFDLASHNI